MGRFRELTPAEIDALREDMRQSSKWAKAELMRRKGRLNDQSHGSGLTPDRKSVV